jgi:hypothetical protein
MDVTKFQSKTFPVEHGRTLFKLSEALLQDNHEGSEQEAEALREQAEVFLERRMPDAGRFDSEEVYDRLIPIFWR